MVSTLASYTGNSYLGPQREGNSGKSGSRCLLCTTERTLETVVMMMIQTIKCILTASVSSVAPLCPTLCHPIDYSMPGFPVHHQLPELAQTHFHWVGNAIQPSHPLSSPSLPVLNLSQHQGLFQWVSSSHQVAKVLELKQCRRLRFNPWVGKIPLEKEIATHSSILAWRIPWTEKPGGL